MTSGLPASGEPFAPIFIVGVGRSGTSLVQSMLAAHSHFAFLPETRFLRRYVGRGHLARLHLRGGAAAVSGMLKADVRLRRLGLDLDQVLSRYQDGAPFSEADLYETLLTSYARACGKPRAGDKDPGAVEFLPLMARHWPAAHVVHVVRDLRDVLASKKKAVWSRHRWSVTHGFVNRVQLRAGRRSGPRWYGARYHEVAYEELIADPEATLRRLTERLGAPYEEGMLEFGDAARSLVSSEELPWKRETLGPLLSENSGKWIHELAPWEAALAAEVCREGVLLVSRERPSQPGLSRAWWLTVRLLALLLGALEWPYRLYRRATLEWRCRERGVTARSGSRDWARAGRRATRPSLHWGFRYLGQHAAQKVLGAIPYGFGVQEFVKRATGRAERFADAGYVRRQLETKINHLNAADITPPGTVVEQGTGWVGTDLVLFHLAGTRRVVTYDTMPWLRPDLLRRNVEILVGATDVVKRWRGTVPDDVDARAERLRAKLDAPWDVLLKRLGATVRVTRSMDRSEVAPASVDLFYSHSVLQFMDPRDLAVLVREARRFLKPSGHCFHTVDCFDSHANRDARIPRLAYLAWPEPAWNLLTSRYLNYQNRWRMPQFVALFRSEGFAARTLQAVVDAEDLAYVERRLARAPRFLNVPPSALATSRFLLVSGEG